EAFPGAMAYLAAMIRPIRIATLAVLCAGCAREPPDIEPISPTPSAEQIRYQEMELAGFIHFSINTFTDREWGFGDESPDLFAPTDLDVDQWARVAAEAGMGELILTTKHHDGFCLWPSGTTDHTVAQSPWRGGEGDLVGEFAEAARRNGLQVGLYLSPWDRNHPDYGSPEYLEAYRAQLRELLSGYGDINEIWVDGANGGTGFYGGANEERRIDRRTYYQWPETMALVKELQPSTLIFSDAGPDIRWIGNERGFAGLTNWSTINTRDIVIGEADVEYLNSGDPAGEDWVVPLCDTSIRPGWFYHPDQDEAVKSPQELVDLYYRSVGRNCVLLLNIPPDRRGRFHDHDVRSLMEFRRILDETFADDLAHGARTEATSWRLGHPKFAPANVVDGDPGSYWAAGEGVTEATVEILLDGEVDFDRILLQEPIRFGQRVSSFSVEAGLQGEWTEISAGTTIGYKRLLRVSPVRADGVRILIHGALAPPALSTVGVYKASPDEPSWTTGG
ncbi:MAG: alpha-L-fucosidase, partial [Gemmatimonadota bacterium]